MDPTHTANTTSAATGATGATGTTSTKGATADDWRQGENAPQRPLGEEAKERAGALWHEAKDTARAKLNEQKDAAAEGIDHVAQALRDSQQQQRDGADGRDPVAGLAGSAAEGLDRLASTLRNKDVGTMLRDMESFARAQPVAFFGLALAAGFLGARFVKSGTGEQPTSNP